MNLFADLAHDISSYNSVHV